MFKRTFVVGLALCAWLSQAALAAPAVSLDAPSPNSTYTLPTTIALTASATDSASTISRVDFYQGGTFIGTTKTSPYTVSWTPTAGGTYSFTAKATSTANVSTTSKAVSVTVANPVTVAITSPASYAQFAPPGPVTLTANASTSTSGGNISKLEFYNGATLLGPATKTSTAYSYTWTGIATGKHSITAKATDNQGVTNTSAPVVVIVNTKPTVSLTSPTANSTYAASGAITLTVNAQDVDGSIAKVQFYDGASLIQPVQTGPNVYQWSTAVTGTHTLKAVVTDNLGSTGTSQTVSVNVVNNQAPTVKVSADPAQAAPPASVTLTATATDSDGSVKQLELYNGTDLLGKSTTSPFKYTWSNVPQGDYTVTAKATDNLGTVTTSDPITVKVGGAVAQAYYIYADHLNTPREVVDQSNKVVWKWNQDEPFGGNAPVASNGFELNLRFPGQYYDKETNLHYNYFRDYDPQIGRYIQSDPIGLAGGINTYGYVGGNPLMSVDPKGLSGCRWIGPVLECDLDRNPPLVDPDQQPLPKPATPWTDIFKPSPYLPTWSLPDWLKGSKMCSAADREKCEKSCDAEYDRGRDFCRAMSGMRGRDKKTFSECMRQVDKQYVACYQSCGK